MRSLESLGSSGMLTDDPPSLLSQSLSAPRNSVSAPAAQTKALRCDTDTSIPVCMPGSPPNEPPPSPAQPHCGLRVLVVDDNKITLAVTARLLQRHFPHLLVPKGAAFAESGAEALQRIRNEVFDVVLLDIHMPDPAGPDGLTCAQAIRQGETCSLASQPNRYAHIIAVTNDCDPLHRSLYRAALLDGLIPKPIRLNHLRQFLETISELANSSCRSGKVPLINETLGPPPLPPALSHEERVFFDPSRSVFPSEPFVQTLADQTRRSVDMLEKSRSAGRGLKCWVHGSSNAAREGGSPLTASTAASPGTPDSTPLLSPRPSATTKREDWTSHVRPWGDNDVEHCNESVFLRSPIV